MKINVEVIIDKMNEWADAERELEMCVKDFDGKLRDYPKWKAHYEYCLNENNNTWNAVLAIFEVFGLRDEACERAWACRRYIRKWYERTGWKRLATEEMMQQCGDYIFQEKSKDHYDYDTGWRFRKEVYAEYTNYWGMR